MLPLHGQNLVELEYFFDDAGPNATTSITGFTSGADVTYTGTLDVSALSTGFHKLHIRAKESNGIWGLFSTSTFYKKSLADGELRNIARLEYFLDDDGFENSTTQNLSPPDTLVDESFVVDLSSLDPGYHTLQVRGVYEDGTKGLPVYAKFYNSLADGLSAFKSIEYFIDNDESLGIRHFPLNVQSDSIVQSFIVDLSNVPFGDHFLYARVKDDLGRTSIVVVDNFEVVADVPPTIFLTGNVAFQGRPAAPNQAYAMPVTIDLYRAQESAPMYSYTPMTDESGDYDLGGLQGVEEGDYVLTAKNAHTLKTAHAKVFIAGNNTVDFEELPEGDANNDNMVSVLDFSQLAASFNLSKGNGNFDPDADFNENNQVNILDFSLLASNYNNVGYEVTLSSFEELIANNPRIAKELRIYTNEDVSLSYRMENNEFGEMELTVTANTKNQKIDGAEFHLKYDTDWFEAIEVEGKEQLPISILNEIDHFAGIVRFAAGSFSDLPHGEIGLATLRFRVKKTLKGKEQPMEFINEGPGETQLTYAGKSVLSGITAGRIILTDCDGCLVSEMISVFPNPTQGEIKLSMPSDVDFESVRITNLEGKVVRNFQNEFGPGILDISDQPSGIYIIMVKHEDSVYTRKVFKQ